MPEVLSAMTGESIAVFEEDEIADASVKALKQRLARKIGVPRFLLQLLQDNRPLDDDQTFPLHDDQILTIQVVHLVKVQFLRPDGEQNQGIMVACEGNDDKLLEQHLNQPRNPNFEDANQITPLYAAASNGNLKCVHLLREAGANKDQGRTDNGSTPLLIAAENWHLEVVRFMVESGANKDQGTSDNGATPLFVSVNEGHLEVVRFLVESGANKDQGASDNGATPLFVSAHQGHLEMPWLFPWDIARASQEPWFNLVPTNQQDQGIADNGATPLVVAAGNGHPEVVRFLVESGANKDQGTTGNGATPLFIAAPQGHLEMPWLFPWDIARASQEPWFNLVPTKTKAWQTMEQRLLS